MTNLDTAGITLVTIFANKMDATRDFYVQHLKFEVLEPFSSPSGDFVWLKPPKNGPSIALQEATGRFEKPVQSDVPLESGGVMIGIEVESAKEAYDYLSEIGTTIRCEVASMGKGMTFGVKDPEGNFLQIYDVDPEIREIQRKMTGMD